MTKKFLARELRQQGMSFGKIAQELRMAKSGTLSQWCRDIKLTREQNRLLNRKEILGARKGSIQAARKARERRLREIKELRSEGMNEVASLTKRDLFMLGIGMYWSEGYTYKGGDQVGFTNSDHQIILLILRWFKEICGIPPSQLTLHVKINAAHSSRVEEIENYWASLTAIPRSQFTKTTLIHTNLKKVYPNPNLYFGTLRITVRNGTKLRRKIHGWLEGVAQNT